MGLLALVMLIAVSGCRHVCQIKTAPKIDAHPENGHISVPLDDTDWLWA